MVGNVVINRKTLFKKYINGDLKWSRIYRFSNYWLNVFFPCNFKVIIVRICTVQSFIEPLKPVEIRDIERWVQARLDGSKKGGRRMEPIRLVCRRSEEVGSFKVRSHILPMNDSERHRSPRPVVPIAREASSRISSREETNSMGTITRGIFSRCCT